MPVVLSTLTRLIFSSDGITHPATSNAVATTPIRRPDDTSCKHVRRWKVIVDFNRIQFCEAGLVLFLTRSSIVSPVTVF